MKKTIFAAVGAVSIVGAIAFGTWFASQPTPFKPPQQPAQMPPPFVPPATVQMTWAQAHHMAPSTKLINECAVLGYDDTYKVEGKLIRLTFPGPPNYENIAKGDAAETGFYLQLSPSLCVHAQNYYSDLESPLKNWEATLIQLVLDDSGYARLKSSVGKKVQVSGNMFESETGHHHAPVLLNVAKIISTRD